MRFTLLTFVICVAISTHVYSFDTELLKADKKLDSSYFSKAEASKIQAKLAKEHDLSDLKAQLIKSISNALDVVESYPNQCDLTFINTFKQEIVAEGLSWQYNHLKEYLIYLRSTRAIDDLFLELMLRNLRFDYAINLTLSGAKVPPNNPNYSGEMKQEKIKKIFSNIGSRWPDGKGACPLISVNMLLSKIRGNFELKKTGSINRKTINYSAYAYHKNYISLENFLRIEALVKEDVIKTPFYLSNYLENIKFAKNKLTDSLGHIRTYDETLDPSQVSKRAKKFSENFVMRRDKITMRQKLYTKYNSTQMMLLAGIIVKASKRMNAYRSEIDIYYQNSDSPDETYVISPMEQYRMALKMLQKDMQNIELMDTFQGKNVDYDDVVMAALETGVITLQELDMVIEHEEFWNPKTPAWKSIISFVFDLAGTASFYLPPPWNVVGAIGLVVTETKVFKASKKIDASKNDNSIF